MIYDEHLICTHELFTWQSVLSKEDVDNSNVLLPGVVKRSPDKWGIGERWIFKST